MLLLSVKTSNGSIFIFYYTSFEEQFFSLTKELQHKETTLFSLDKEKIWKGEQNRSKKTQSHLLFVLKRKNEALLPQKTRRFFFFAYSFSLPPCNNLVSRNFGHFCKEWGKITVVNILLEFSWNFSVSLYWKRKIYNAPKPLSPYSDTSAYHLHTWNVLVNLTVYFKAVSKRESHLFPSITFVLSK